ncbi:MAG: hypothetical protein ACRBF0_08660 [Calditrichia bacterium]
MNYPIHALLSAVSILLPFTIGISVRKSFNLANGLFWSYIVFLTIVQLGMMWLAGMRINNIWILNLMIPVQSVWLAYLLYLWAKRPQMRVYLNLSLGLLISVWIVSQYFIGSLHRLNFVTLSIQCVIFSILCVLALYGLIERQAGIVHQDERFWFILGLLFYFAGTSLFYTLGYVLEEENSRSLWIIHSFTNIIANLLHSWGFLCLSRR